jgi:predicted metal-dependent hydrolase
MPLTLAQLERHLFAAADMRAMKQFIREKRFWIYTKLAEKEALAPPPPAKREGFPYLGRSYRLLLVDHQEAPVKLDHGRFRMAGAVARDRRSQMVRWYTDRANPWLTKLVERYQWRFRVAPTAVTVRDLGFRWGSCAKGGKLYFHWRTILLPRRIIEYVVAHELAHLREPNHTPAFWAALERGMPDFAMRKRWLAENGAAIAAI